MRERFEYFLETFHDYFYSSFEEERGVVFFFSSFYDTENARFYCRIAQGYILLYTYTSSPHEFLLMKFIALEISARVQY